MLVYIRESELERVLQEVTKKDIPFELAEKLEEEKQMEAARRRERSETSSYTTINVLLEDYLENHEKTDLCDFEHVVYRSFKIKKCVTVNEMMEQFADTFKVTSDKMRIWPVRPSQLQYTRFGMFDVQENGAKKVSDFIDGSSPWIIFLQLLSPDSEMQTLPAFNKETDILLFFKCYDSHYKRLNYCGLQYCDKATKFSTLIPELNKRAGYATDTELRLYEEKSANNMEPIGNYDSTIEQTLNDLTHGFVIIFEKKVKEDNLELPTVVDYINDLMCRHEITFVDKTNPNDTGFVLILSERTNYDQLAEAVGQRIGSDPYQIQFFKCQNFKDTPGRALSCTYKEKLNEMLLYNRPKSTKKIFYQRLTMNINELERKKQFKCLFLSPNMKDETELVLYLSKTGTVKTLLDEAAKVVKFSENGTKRLRISEISSHKILPGPPDATSLDNLQVINDTGMTMANQKVYRLEEIPNDELTLNDNEMLLPVVHFYKDVFHTFGIPFFVKMVNNEPLTALKERIQKKLNLPDKEWDNYKLARIVAGNAEYMNDDKALMDMDMFQVAVPHGGQKPFLGLEHINKSQKRSRFNYFEKAIKIYN
jgi:ubiquitin carboxyl-terminal hydrolase 7